jgi:hypothetical protein
MKFLDHKSTDSSQWEFYKQLEMIPECIPSPLDRANHFSSLLNLCWRPLLGLLIDELIPEQRVDYLERCWTLNELEEGNKSQSNSLHRFFVLIS